MKVGGCASSVVVSTLDTSPMRAVPSLNKKKKSMKTVTVTFHLIQALIRQILLLTGKCESEKAHSVYLGLA